MANGLKILKEVTMAEVRQRAHPYRMAFYGANTCWWTSSENDLYKKPGSGLPCDPRGGMLFQTSDGDLGKFLDSAQENVEHYGKHGIRAFLAAYHGVVIAANGNPTCCESWKDYNDLLDELDEASK
jgi:hypothetical protein